MAHPTFLDTLLHLPLFWHGQVSPDGKWLAWSWFHTGVAADVYLTSTDGKGVPVRMTQAVDDTAVCAWTLDSKALLLVQDRDGDERLRIFRADLSRPGQLEPLTEENPQYFLRGGQLHPNGRWLIYGANFDFARSKEIDETWVYRHDIVTGEHKVLARPCKSGNTVPDMNMQGTHILYPRNDIHPAGQQYWLIDMNGENDHEILNFGPDKKVIASWFPDGERILFLAEVGAYRKLGIFHRVSQTISWLWDDPSRNLEAARAVPRSPYVIVEEIKNARAVGCILDLNTGTEKVVTVPDGTLLPAAMTADGAWLGLFYSATQPMDVVRFALTDVEPAHFHSLTGLWTKTSLQPSELAKAEDFCWKSVDGLEIHGWLYRTNKEVRGTILLVHGGPTAHSENRFETDIQYFVHEGFQVLDPNYRGSTGYGLAFQDSIKKCGWGGKEQEDIRTGIEALMAAGIAKRGKIGITGTSYGGYTAWYAITHFPKDVVAAAAPICGMTDLVVDYETTRPDLRPYSEEMMGGSPTQVPERYRERSPIHFLRNIQGKLLIVQGEQDPNVSPENVKQVEAGLKECGIIYELLCFKDEGHGIYKPKNERILLRRLVKFFSRAFAW